ncbi:MAG: hypothetical protein C4320_06575, partial [Armatimonadota bacterium]
MALRSNPPPPRSSSADRALILIPPQVDPPVICLDPGHTSEVGEGTRGKRLTELSYVWQVAASLCPLLLQAGYTVVLTKRTVGQRVTNRERAEIANRSGAALMLRLHCDSAPNS